MGIKVVRCNHLYIVDNQGMGYIAAAVVKQIVYGYREEDL